MLAALLIIYNPVAAATI